MNKRVITSVSPKECELIASGRQTMLVRKTRPKIETPFKCYIYCTKQRMTKVPCMYSYLHINEPKASLIYGERITTWGNIGDVIVNRTTPYEYVSYGMQGKVIGEFVCDEIYVRPANVIYYGKGQEDYLDLLKSACMTEREVLDYMGGQFNRETYFWHVTDLKIYDKPKELGEFRTPFPFSKYCLNCEINENRTIKAFNTEYCSACSCFKDNLTRPPQSWMFVEELQ